MRHVGVRWACFCIGFLPHLRNQSPTLRLKQCGGEVSKLESMPAVCMCRTVLEARGRKGRTSSLCIRMLVGLRAASAAHSVRSVRRTTETSASCIAAKRFTCTAQVFSRLFIWCWFEGTAVWRFEQHWRSRSRGIESRQ